MTPEQIQLVQTTWAAATQSGTERLGSVFLHRLAQMAPETGTTISGGNRQPSYRVLKGLRGITAQLQSLSGRERPSHEAYSIDGQQYFVLGNALLWSLEKSLQGQWTEAAEEAWALFVEKTVWNLTKKEYLQPAA
jgi:hemoglobin-like flavoprotein